MTMRPWRRSGARSSARHWLTAPNGRRTESEENSLSLSKLITTGAGSTALWGTNHLWISKTRTTNNERTDSIKLGPKNRGKGTGLRGFLYSDSPSHGFARTLLGLSQETEHRIFG